jgi:UDP-N-acetylmuramate--alanine ligase
MAHYHFSGLAGQGMNPLAQLMAAWGHRVQGSDRSFDRGQQPELRARLVAAGIAILPHDGSAVGAQVERFVHSAAVEADAPEMAAARRLGIACLPRPALLAEIVDGGRPGIAVAGTSGKSTVTGMIAWILRTTATPATVLGGAALAGEGTAGLFAAGPAGGPVVAEACESDGTLVGYHPAVGLVHNISRDHGEMEGLRAQFASFAGNAAVVLANAGCAEAVAATAGAVRRILYGSGGRAEVALEVIAPGPHQAHGLIAVDGCEHDLRLQLPGAHNLENACAALAAARAIGIPPAAACAALATFPGVSRRYEVIGVTDTGIRVVDDYAHNPEKIRAAIRAAQAGCDRLIAIFQPHGFGPARLMRPDLKAILPSELRPADRFCYAPIYYAGGSVARDLSHRDLAADSGVDAVDDRAALLAWVSERALPGDTVLLMGARDPELPRLARAIFDLL